MIFWSGGKLAPSFGWLLLRRQKSPQFIVRQRELAAEPPGTYLLHPCSAAFLR